MKAGRLVVWALALASLCFYAYDSIAYAGVMLASILVNYGAGRVLCARRTAEAARRPLVVASVTLNLALLGYFKYAGFVVANAGGILDLAWTAPKILLPLGISFYTFTQIAYVVDCYRDRDADTRFGSFLLFVTFFPHLIAGPIVYHREMMPQFAQLGRGGLAWESVETGLFLFMIGLIKKVCLADVLAEWVNPGYGAVQSLGTADAWLLSVGYSLQLYFDFSAYSDMAIGLGLLFGIRFPVNFDSPYRARTVREFWHRWHITLSRWLQRFVYIPLGGNRGGVALTLRNLMLTFLLGGIWHGAGWGFIIWGLLHGLGCCFDRLFPGAIRITPRPLAILATFLFVNVTFVFFRAPDLDSAFTVLRAMAGFARVAEPLAFFAAGSTVLVAALAAGLAICWFAPNSQTIAFGKIRVGHAAKAAYCGLALVLFIFMTRGSPPAPFLYFNF